MPIMKNRQYKPGGPLVHNGISINNRPMYVNQMQNTNSMSQPKYGHKRYLQNYKNIVKEHNSVSRGPSSLAPIDTDLLNFNSNKKSDGSDFNGHSQQANQIVMRHRSNIRNIIGNKSGFEQPEQRHLSINSQERSMPMVSQMQLKGTNKRVLVNNAYSSSNPAKQFNKLPNVKPALVKGQSKHAMSLNQIPQH